MAGGLDVVLTLALWFAKTRRDRREPGCSSGLRSDGTRADLFERVRSLAIARVATRRAAAGDGGGSPTAEVGWDISPGWRVRRRAARTDGAGRRPRATRSPARRRGACRRGGGAHLS